MELITNRVTMVPLAARAAVALGWDSGEAIERDLARLGPQVTSLLSWRPGQSLSFLALVQLSEVLRVPCTTLLQDLRRPEP